MTIKSLFLAAAIISSFTLTQPAFAHSGKKHDNSEQHGQAEHEHGSKAVTETDALADIQASVTSIGGMIEAGTLDAIHEEVEKAEAAIEAVKHHVSLEGDKKTRLESALKQLSSQLGKLHTASDAKDAEKTKAEFKKTKGALKLVESALK